MLVRMDTIQDQQVKVFLSTFNFNFGHRLMDVQLVNKHTYTEILSSLVLK